MIAYYSVVIVHHYYTQTLIKQILYRKYCSLSNIVQVYSLQDAQLLQSAQSAVFHDVSQLERFQSAKVTSRSLKGIGTGAVRTAFADFCLDRFFWATRFVPARR